VPRTARPVSRTRSHAHELVRQFTRLLKPLELLRALRRDDPEALLAEHHTSTSPIVRNGLGSQLSQASGSRSMGTNGEGATLPYLGITAWRVDASQQSELEGDPDVQAADCIHKRCSCHRSRRGHAGEGQSIMRGVARWPGASCRHDLSRLNVLRAGPERGQELRTRDLPWPGQRSALGPVRDGSGWMALFGDRAGSAACSRGRELIGFVVD
jgi:hypothetical protein